MDPHGQHMDVEDKINTQEEKWEEWGSMLRNHPTALRGIIDLLPASKNLLDAIYRTRAIVAWMEEHRCQLCQVYCAEIQKDRNYVAGAYFGSPPYGPEKPVPGVGSLYVDPYLAANPITWKMVDDKRIEVDGVWHDLDPERLLQATEQTNLDQVWRDKMRRAELDWFSNSSTAPVAVLRWEEKEKHDSGFSQFSTWDATQDLLAANPLSRTSVRGWRPGHTPIPDFLSCVDEHIRARGCDYTLSLHIYQASETLIAHRNAIAIESQTPDTPSGTPHNGRRL